MLKGDPELHDLAFPFDQGRHEEKGFEIQRYKNGVPRGWRPGPRWEGTPVARAYNMPKFDIDAHEGLREEIDAWLEDWVADYNLGRPEWDFLMDWLEASGREVGHTYQNAAFDLLMLDAGTRVRDAGDGGGYPGRWLEPFVVWDTMLVSKNLWPQSMTGLKPTGARLFGEEAVADAAELKDALLDAKKIFGLVAADGPRYDLVPWRINGKYAATDTKLTHKIQALQFARLEEGEGSWFAARRELNLMRVLTRMSRRGLGPYSVDESASWANVIGARAAELVPRLPFVRLGAIPSDKTTPEQRDAWSRGEERPVVSASAARAAEYYFEVLGLEPWKVGEQPRGYEVKTSKTSKKFVRGRKEDRAEIMRRFPDAKKEDITFKQGELTATIAERIGELEYAEYLRLKIANQMFYRNYADLAGPGNKLRTTYRQAHVKSARLSVERFQAQALPKRLDLKVNGHPVPEPRAFFGVPEGRQRWNLDLSQAELRIGSHAVGARAMYELLDTGSDLHGETCKRLFDLPGEDHPDWKPKRDISKRANFGLIFNMGAVTFRKTLWNQAQLEMSLAELRDIVDAWRELYPEFGQAWHYWHDYALRNNHVVLVNGERSWFTDRDYPNTALNRVVQGSLAAWVAEWLTLVEQVTEKYDALVLSVHDSAVLDLPEDTAAETVARVRELSEELWYDRLGYPGKVDADLWKYHEGVDLLVPTRILETYPAALSCPQDDNPEFTYEGAVA